jgi:hypothetical protein
MGTERRKGLWLPLWISIGIAIGLFIGSKFSIFNTPGNLVGSGKLDAVLNYIHESYVDTVNTYQLVEDALPNIIQELDQSLSLQQRLHFTCYNESYIARLNLSPILYKNLNF